MDNIHLINIFGGPETGKSEVASIIYSSLKLRGFNCILVPSFPVELIVNNRIDELSDELMVTVNQKHRIENSIAYLKEMTDEDKYIITSAPVAQCALYMKLNDDKYPKEIVDYFINQSKLYKNHNYYIKRPRVRREALSENELESYKIIRALDKEILNMLEDYEFNYNIINKYSAEIDILKDLTPEDQGD